MKKIYFFVLLSSLSLNYKAFAQADSADCIAIELRSDEKTYKRICTVDATENQTASSSGPSSSLAHCAGAFYCYVIPNPSACKHSEGCYWVW